MLMKNKQSNMTAKNELYYYIPFAIVGLLLIGGSLIYKFYLNETPMIPECIIHKLAGVYCPACGGTRAVMSLLAGDFKESVLYNPVVLYGAVLWIFYMIFNTAILLFTHRKDRMIHLTRMYILIGGMLLAVNFIMKNV